MGSPSPFLSSTVSPSNIQQNFPKQYNKLCLGDTAAKTGEDLHGLNVENDFGGYDSGFQCADKPFNNTSIDNQGMPPSSAINRMSVHSLL